MDEIGQQEAAELAMQFMQRVQLQGQEVPAFNAAMTWLSNMAAPVSERAVSGDL